MKQLLFLLLFPCLALAQYQGNSNQKITLGEQTTADGLVFRGVASIDTVTATSKITRANKQDTSAYILLDTVTNLLWHYKIGSNAWTQAGGSTLDTATMLLPYYRAGRNTIIQAADVPTLNQNTTGSAATLTTGRTIQTNLASTSAATFNGSANITPGITGTLGGGNGGTGLTTFGAATNLPFAASTTALKTNSRINVIEFGSIPVLQVDGGIRLQNAGSFQFYNQNNAYNFQFSTPANTRVWELQNYAGSGVFIARGVERNFGIRYNFADSAQVTEALTVNGNAKITGLANAANPVNVQVDVNGVLVRTSSIDIKEDVQSLPYGLNEVMLLQPSKFSYIDKYKYGEGYDIGFIAQDVNNIIPEAVGTGIESDIFMDSVKLIPVLTKAIQEQQALIKALEQRILILENK